MNSSKDALAPADRKLPMLQLDGAALPEALRLSAFAAVASGYSVQPLAPPGEEFQVDCRAWQLGDLVITANRISAVRIERTLSHIRADGRDTYSFALLRRGSWNATIDAGFIQVASGQIGVMDFAESWQVEGTDQDNIILVVPRALVQEIAPGAPPLHGRGDAGRGRAAARRAYVRAGPLPARDHDRRRPDGAARDDQPAVGGARRSDAGGQPAVPAPAARVRRQGAGLYRGQADRSAALGRDDMPERSGQPRDRLQGVSVGRRCRCLHPAPAAGGRARPHRGRRRRGHGRDRGPVLLQQPGPISAPPSAAISATPRSTRAAPPPVPATSAECSKAGAGS